MTQTELAERIGVSRLSVSELVHEKRGLSPEMALRLATLLQTTPESWLACRRRSTYGPCGRMQKNSRRSNP
jgi:addiction module HigA family antidote